ncbi:MAG: hypothetical protein U0694_06400 [Anaerolineae bacterium]
MRELLEVDGVTLGYPLAFVPAMLMYDPAQFERMGVPQPTNDWQIGDFILALQLLRPDSTAGPVLGASAANDYFQPLVAAYGGNPLDFSTTPPTINLTQPQTVEALRQVLDLARGGYTTYHETPVPGSSVFSMLQGLPLWHSDVMVEQFQAGQSNAAAYPMVLYPRGSSSSPLPITPIMGYISRQSLHPEACYRWLSYLSLRPDVVGMPARLSQVDEFVTVSGLGDSVFEVYAAMEARAAVPGSLQLSSVNNEIYSGRFEIQLRAHQAYDQYVLENVPLDTALASAQSDIELFLACIVDVPPLAQLVQLSDFERAQYDDQYKNCVRNNLPVAAWLYGG